MSLAENSPNILITGARGFVAAHLLKALRQAFDGNVAIVATAKEAGEHPLFGSVMALDVTDASRVDAAIANCAPTHIVHLAGIASPFDAGASPRLAWQVNVEGTLNVAHAIMNRAPDCWMLHAGSGLVYGESAHTGRPLDEATLLAPTDEYSATKASADLALGALVRRGLKCIRLRPFNHTGPGQAETFVVPGFAMQIARIEAGLAPPTIRVGNLDAERDFLDVRDVVDAYARVLRSCKTLQSGMVFNIASGVPRRIGGILEALLKLSHSAIAVERVPERMRMSDLPRIVGDAGRARKMLQWAPKHAFDDTLAAVLNDCRTRVTL